MSNCKYSVADIELDLVRAGVNLTDETRNHFSNFDHEGCVRAIQWLVNHAPWLDSRASFDLVQKQYLCR